MINNGIQTAMIPSQVNEIDYITDSVSLLGDEVLVISMEECSELIKELSKIHRGKKVPNNPSVIEEISDVLICIDWMKSYLGLVDSDINKMKSAKIDRIKDKISKGTLK